MLLSPGEQLSSVSLDPMEEVVGVEAGASSASAAPDCDDSLSQPSSIALVESIDEALVPDIIAGATTSKQCFQRSRLFLVVLSGRYSNGSLCEGAPPLSSLEKEKDIDFDLLQDLMDVDIDPLDIDLEKDPLAAKVFKVRPCLVRCHGNTDRVPDDVRGR